MSNSYFQFKQFTVWQDKCAMKVGTDGVLLGAWTDIKEADKILDVGTGTALLTLMLAQRCNAEIWGIEIDGFAAEQAQENVTRSPWKDRIHLVKEDFRKWSSEIKYDVIISNPPYFKNSLKSPDSKRTIARHTDELPFQDLLKGVSRLLRPTGRFSVIFPLQASKEFMEIAREYELFPVRETKIRTTPSASPKRVLMEFGFNFDGVKECMKDELIIELSRHNYSEEYKELTKDFYISSFLK